MSSPPNYVYLYPEQEYLRLLLFLPHKRPAVVGHSAEDRLPNLPLKRLYQWRDGTL